MNDVKSDRQVLRELISEIEIACTLLYVDFGDAVPSVNVAIQGLREAVLKAKQAS